ncbi:MAG: hypothetical protein IPL23_29405 [Saprospiraceae bacterium]|nr:hypothetical protein [Saprospiraceae bacterium]MBP7642487.1 hypothetical protein [Saprospiraceae bacterium]
MEKTMLIEITDQKAVRLLHELEEQNLIKVIQENFTAPKTKLSDKYRGSITKETADKLRAYLKQSQEEWGDRFPV